ASQLDRPPGYLPDPARVVAARDAIGRVHQRADRAGAPPQPPGASDEPEEHDGRDRDRDAGRRVPTGGHRRHERGQRRDEQDEQQERDQGASPEPPTRAAEPTSAHPWWWSVAPPRPAPPPRVRHRRNDNRR